MHVNALSGFAKTVICSLHCNVFEDHEYSPPSVTENSDWAGGRDCGDDIMIPGRASSLAAVSSTSLDHGATGSTATNRNLEAAFIPNNKGFEPD